MSLVFAGITPHSPILVRGIGQEHLERAKKTMAALETLEGDLYASKPDTVLIISPQDHADCEHFTVGLNDRFVCDLKEFGDLETSLTCRPDPELAQHLREHLEDAGIPVMFRTAPTLDHGITVPLLHLTSELKDVRVLPLYPSLLDLRTHLEFGRILHEAVQTSGRRIAVLASVGLSHRVTEDAPGGFSPRGEAFDELIVQLIGHRNTSGLVNFDEEFAAEAAENCLRPLVMLSGMLERTRAEADILSYEAPFGIGHLVAEYHLH